MRPEGKNQGVLHRSPDTWSWPRRRNGASHLSLQRPVHSTWPQGFRTLMSLILRPWKFTSKEKVSRKHGVMSLTLAFVIHGTRVRFYVWRHYSGSWVKHTGDVLPKRLSSFRPTPCFSETGFSIFWPPISHTPVPAS